MSSLIIGTALAYMGGISLASVWEIPSLFLWLGVSAFLLLALGRLAFPPGFSSKKSVVSEPERDIPFLASVLLTVFCLGSLAYEVHSLTPADNIAHLLGTKRTAAILRGVVVEDPERTLDPGGCIRMRLVVDINRVRLDEGRDSLQVTALKRDSLSGTDDKGNLPLGEVWLKASGRVKVHLKGGEVIEAGPEGNQDSRGRLCYGDDLLFKAQIQKPRGLANPGEFDYQTFLQRRGIYALAWVRDTRDIVRVGQGRLNPLLGKIYELRYRLEKIIEKTIPAPERGLLKAMLLGQRRGITREMREEFVETGTVHILAISGLHVGIVALTLLGILKLLRLPRKLRYGLALVLLVAFAFLTGARPPVIRATLMAGVVMSAFLLERKTNVYTSLGLAALIMLIVNPRFLFDVGFQLSFIAVTSIVCLCPKIEEELFGRAKIWIQNQLFENSEFTNLNQGKTLFSHIGLRICRYLITLFSVSAAAWIGIMPIIWRNFYIIAPVALLANLFAVPLLFVCIISGLGLILGGLIWVEGAAWLWAGICQLALRSLIAGNALFLQIPGSHFYLGPPPLYFLWVYYLLIGLALWKTRLSQLRLKTN